MPLLMMHLYEFVPHYHFELTVLCSTLSLWICAHCHFELTVLCSTLSFWAYGLNLCLTVILNSLSYAQRCHFDYYILDYCTSHFLLLHLSSYCLQFFGLWKFLSYYSTPTPTLYYSCTLLLLLGAALVYYYFIVLHLLFSSTLLCLRRAEGPRCSKAFVA
jgi:hypothetical protein